MLNLQTIRFALRYEDPYTPEYTDKKMNEWTYKHTDSKIIELKE